MHSRGLAGLRVLQKSPEALSALFVLSCFVIRRAATDVVVISLESNRTSDIFPDLPATFGIAIPDEGILGRYSVVSPPEGCTPMAPPPPIAGMRDLAPTRATSWVALIRKGGCDYKTKVWNAMQANYSAAIIYNVGSNRLELMRCKGAGCSDLIPSMFIGADDGMVLQRYDSKYYLLFLTDELPFDLNKYLLPFAVVVGICFFILLIFMIYKCIRDSRRARRHRMPSRALKKITQIKFKKGDPYDICAICLDEYTEGEKLRVLNCSHAFHCKCVDPWLTKSRRVCPICKRKVFASGERHVSGDSSSSDDDGGSRASSRGATRRTTTDEEEAAPLLPPTAAPSSGQAGGERESRARRFLSFLWWRGGAESERGGEGESGGDEEAVAAAAARGRGYGATGREQRRASSEIGSSDHSINGDNTPEAESPGQPVAVRTGRPPRRHSSSRRQHRGRTSNDHVDV